MTNKLISKIKNKLIKNKNIIVEDEEYMFSTKEIEDLKEQNKQKIENLKMKQTKEKKVSFTSVSKKLNGILDEEQNQDITENIDINEESKSIEEKQLEQEEISTKKEVSKEEKIPTEKTKKEEIPSKENSYINLTQKNQEIIMKSWNEIDLQQIDKDIIEGKDLLNHNYNITYGDNAARFVHNIRKKYEIVICYLIGFNNEKKGIMNKTIFADRIDDEWKFLSNYIKLLEKIRSFRK